MDPKDPSDPGAKDARQKEADDLKKLLAEMKKQLEEEKKKKDEPQKPQDLGGCCGKSHGSPQAGDKNQDGDPNSVLLQDVAAVKTAGKHGGGGARNKLSTDYDKFKQEGAQIRPEVEQQVQEALSGGGGQPSRGGQQPKGTEKTHAAAAAAKATH